MTKPKRWIKWQSNGQWFVGDSKDFVFMAVTMNKKHAALIVRAVNAYLKRKD